MPKLDQLLGRERKKLSSVSCCSNFRRFFWRRGWKEIERVATTNEVFD